MTGQNLGIKNMPAWPGGFLGQLLSPQIRPEKRFSSLRTGIGNPKLVLILEPTWTRDKFLVGKQHFCSLRTQLQRRDRLLASEQMNRRILSYSDTYYPHLCWAAAWQDWRSRRTCGASTRVLCGCESYFRTESWPQNPGHFRIKKRTQKIWLAATWRTWVLETRLISRTSNLACRRSTRWEHAMLKKLARTVCC